MPSVNVPVAVNCSLVPSGIDALAALIESDTSAAEVTVRFVCPDTLPKLAVIVAIPIPREVTCPVLLTVAVLVLVEAHVTADVRFCVLPSEYVPVAVNCSAVPSGIELFAGVTAIDCSVCAATVSVVEPLTLEDVAVIFADPAAIAVASPPEAIVATTVFDDPHATVFVMSFVLPSE